MITAAAAPYRIVLCSPLFDHIAAAPYRRILMFSLSGNLVSHKGSYMDTESDSTSIQRHPDCTPPVIEMTLDEC